VWIVDGGEDEDEGGGRVVFVTEDVIAQAIASALCHTCAAAKHLTERVVEKYRESMIPDLRVLPQRV
jgi:hypothetical protein